MNVFDIIGPIMIGPSSSHTAGAARIGKFAYNLLQDQVEKGTVMFHGSFAKTYKGHGSDRAIVGGILGMDTDDLRIPDSLSLAKEQNISIEITTGVIPNAHPNAAKVALTGVHRKQVEIVGESIGGGNIRITQINGLKVNVSGHYDTLIVVHKDTPGVVAATANYLSGQGVNIHNIALSREERGGTAILTIEVDGTLDPEINPPLSKLENVTSSVLIPKL